VLRKQFSAVPGVERVLGPEEFESAGYPPVQNERMSDLVLSAREGYAFDGRSEGETVTPVAAGASPGAHGYLRSDAEMDAVLIISGAGIRSGLKLGRVSNLDVAPTAASLLGLELKDVERKALPVFSGARTYR
jgi:hypothetical protein